jgi:hypothetical protein
MQGGSIVELDFNQNNLKGELLLKLPDELGKLTALVKLVLWGNGSITSTLS